MMAFETIHHFNKIFKTQRVPSLRAAPFTYDIIIMRAYYNYDFFRRISHCQILCNCRCDSVKCPDCGFKFCWTCMKKAHCHTRNGCEAEPDLEALQKAAEEKRGPEEGARYVAGFQKYDKDTEAQFDHRRRLQGADQSIDWNIVVLVMGTCLVVSRSHACRTHE